MRKKDLWAWSVFLVRGWLSTVVIQLHRNPLKRHVKFMRSWHVSPSEPSWHVRGYGFLDFLITQESLWDYCFLRSHMPMSCPSFLPSVLPSFTRTVSSSWWSLWMAVILCSTSRSPGSLKSTGPVSTPLRSPLLSCSYIAKASSTGGDQGAQIMAFTNRI